MGAVSIQNDLCSQDRITRWGHIADTFGLPMTEGQVAELADLDDRGAARRFLPHLHDAELDEVLWALGR